MFLVLIETSGNQQFIFSTNKLKENIGASELTYRATTETLLAAIDEVFPGTLYYSSWQKEQSLEILTDIGVNPAIESKGSNIPLEIILATSGKAIILIQEEEKAKALIRSVTQRALTEAPGLEVAGVYVPCDWNQSLGVADAVRRAHQAFEISRSRRPGANSRFLRVPIIASCSVSELPASGFDYAANGQQQPFSQVSLTKRQAASLSQQRLQAIDPKLIKDVSRLEKNFNDLDWLGIVHADGNGLGQILLNLEKYISQPSNRCYIDTYRNFSLALDRCTKTAFSEAIKVFESSNQSSVPVVPLILGGDDLTVICNGQYALEFTRVFLDAFEKATAQEPAIAAIAGKVFGTKNLSACAGVAIVKPHFPFSVAYDLAESLIKSAKEVKKTVQCQAAQNIAKNTPHPCSAIDFHILYESSGIDFDDIRQKLTPEQNTYLHNRPYVVTPLAKLKQAEGQDWVNAHHWQKLADRVDLLHQQEQGKPCLPSSQSHALRTALFQGKGAADGQYALIRQRYKILSQFAESSDGKSLFRSDGNGASRYYTIFLDALDAKDFLKNAQSTAANSGDKS